MKKIYNYLKSLYRQSRRDNFQKIKDFNKNQKDYSLSKKKVHNATQRKKIELQGLRDFVDNIYWNDNLAPDKSIFSVEQGVVELLYKNSYQHSSNGLLLTEDGYVITCYHCINKEIENMFAGMHGNKLYEIERICSISKKRDLALIKINKKGKSKALNYRFLNNGNFSAGSVKHIVLLTRKNGNINRIGGTTNGYMFEKVFYYKEGKNTHEQILANMKAISGDSGGVIVSVEGEVFGIHVGSAVDSYQAYFAAWHNALDVISKYIIKKS